MFRQPLAGPRNPRAITLHAGALQRSLARTTSARHFPGVGMFSAAGPSPWPMTQQESWNQPVQRGIALAKWLAGLWTMLSNVRTVQTEREAVSNKPTTPAPPKRRTRHIAWVKDSKCYSLLHASLDRQVIPVAFEKRCSDQRRFIAGLSAVYLNGLKCIHAETGRLWIPRRADS